VPELLEHGLGFERGHGEKGSRPAPCRKRLGPLRIGLL
jgi:hypothetical protein